MTEDHPLIRELQDGRIAAESAAQARRDSLKRTIEEQERVLANGPNRMASARLEQATRMLKTLIPRVEITQEPRRIALLSIAAWSRQTDLPPGLGELLDAQSAHRLLERTREALLVAQSQQEPYQRVGRALAAIAEGFRSGLGAAPVPSRQNLESALVGRSTAEELIAALHIQNLPNPVSAEAADWLRRWIQEASDEERALFCMAVTGSPALPPGAALNLSPQADVTSIPSAHTCAVQFDLPNYQDYPPPEAQAWHPDR